jgi:hypothetical protein
MSIISTAANYGGKVADTQQGVKQFFVSPPSAFATWIFQRINGGTTLVQTPANASTPIVINNDLVVAGSLYNTSDSRLKERIESIDPVAVDNLFTLNPIHFCYKSDTTKKTHFGFLAQDVEQVFPDMVEDTHLGYKTVNYQEMIPLIFAKVKQLQKEVDELRATRNV